MWVIGVPVIFVDMLPMGVCTTRYWPTSDRLVQELNVCTEIYSGTYMLNPWSISNYLIHGNEECLCFETTRSILRYIKSGVLISIHV